MKVCTKCDKTKSVADFFVKHKPTGRLHAQCKECYKAHRKTYYEAHYKKYKEQYVSRAKARREKLRDEFRSNILAFLRRNPCTLCGEPDVRVLEFDHLEPSLKEFTISQAVRDGYSWSNVEEEIKKCRVLCANCHKKHTASQANWYKNLEARTGVEPV